MKSDTLMLVAAWSALALLVLAAFWWSGNRNAVLYYPNARQHQKEYYPLAAATTFITTDTVTDVLAYYEQFLTQRNWEYIVWDFKPYAPSKGDPATVICFNRFTGKAPDDKRTDSCGGDDALHNYYYGEQISIAVTEDGLTKIHVRD